MFDVLATVVPLRIDGDPFRQDCHTERTMQQVAGSHSLPARLVSVQLPLQRVSTNADRGGAYE
jgi:hypothetical protein